MQGFYAMATKIVSIFWIIQLIAIVLTNVDAIVVGFIVMRIIFNCCERSKV